MTLVVSEADRVAEDVARQFHETYERLAPQFGYETRADTRAFDPASANGRLMIAVCNEVLARHAAAARLEGARETALANIRFFNRDGPNHYTTSVVGWGISGPTREDVIAKVNAWFDGDAADLPTDPISGEGGE